MGRTPERTSCHYAKGALQYMVPLLTEIMTRQVSLALSSVHPTCKIKGS